MTRRSIVLLALAQLLFLVCFGQVRGVKTVEPDIRSERRVALVIGNSAYKEAPLRNPANDARLVASTLKDLGFEVMNGENLSQKEMKRIIRDFGQEIRGSGVGLFYYAGHGIQSNGRNYLVPIGADIAKEQDIDLEAVDAGYVLAEMEAANNRMNILILDACRNNPFGRSYRSSNRGLVQMAAPTGTFIAYATAPGSVAADGDGSNGLYAQALARAMRIAGAKLEDVFKTVLSSVKKASRDGQVPWIASSVEGDFYFAQVADTGKANSQPIFTLGDLNMAAKNEESLKKSWANALTAMQEAYDEVLTFEKRDVSAKLKADAWKRFIASYAADDPYSAEDNLMRDQAQTQMTYWEGNRNVEVPSSAKSRSSGQVEFTTNLGKFTILLFEREAPITTKNFVAYVDSGFYGGLIFHRVIAGFMVQGGAFLKNLMKRPPMLEPIKNESDNGMKNDRGTIAMARTSDPNSATSQFFINVVDNGALNYSPQGWGYAVFGKVVEGMDVGDKIAAVKTGERNGMGDVPIEPIIIISVKRK